MTALNAVHERAEEAVEPSQHRKEDTPVILHEVVRVEVVAINEVVSRF